MGYLIFRGVSTSSLTNVYVSEMPSHKKAAMRATEYYVNGRDGALHVNEGLQNFDIKVVLVLVNATASTRQTVNAWADGTGELVSSDDLTKAYMASVIQDITWQRVKANAGYYDTATITFNCQPCMVEATDSTVTLNASGTITNPGSAVAYPLIQVNGSGDADFTFNGSHIYIDDMSAGTPVYIDCANGYVYTQTGATSIRGEIPYLDYGDNTVTFGSNVTSLVVTPHWRWV